MDLTEGESRYLKLIYRKQHEGGEKVKTTSLADSVGVRPATVTEALQKLAGKGILSHEPYHGVRLTGKGVLKAKSLLRKHRLLEFLFNEKLGYDSQRSCEEASKIDFRVSEDLIRSVCRVYGHPDTCPCGKIIYSDSECTGD